MKNKPNPMQRAFDALKLAPKCGAFARTTGETCKNASMANGRCRMHGGKSSGRPVTHGQRTKLAKQNRLQVREILNLLLKD